MFCDNLVAGPDQAARIRSRVAGCQGLIPEDLEVIRVLPDVQEKILSSTKESWVAMVVEDLSVRGSL